MTLPLRRWISEVGGFFQLLIDSSHFLAGPVSSSRPALFYCFFFQCRLLSVQAARQPRESRHLLNLTLVEQRAVLIQEEAVIIRDHIGIETHPVGRFISGRPSDLLLIVFHIRLFVRRAAHVLYQRASTAQSAARSLTLLLSPRQFHRGRGNGPDHAAHTWVESPAKIQDRCVRSR